MDLIEMIEQMKKNDAHPITPLEEVIQSDPEVLPPEPVVPAVQTSTPAPEQSAPQTLMVDVPPEVAYSQGGMRYKLIFEGACSHCAHCGQPLTDSVSVERGIGPVCCKKGYFDEVTGGDDMEAMIALAQYPELVAWLTKKYKPQGNRALVNGLVRTASLNRRTPVHAACCDAVEALGFKRLGSALRESISVVEIFDVPAHPNCYGLWVKKADYSYMFDRAVKALAGVSFQKYPQKATVVPKVHRIALAKLILQFYAGLNVKTGAGAFKITPDWFAKAQAQAA